MDEREQAFKDYQEMNPFPNYERELENADIGIDKYNSNTYNKYERKFRHVVVVCEECEGSGCDWCRGKGSKEVYWYVSDAQMIAGEIIGENNDKE